MEAFDMANVEEIILVAEDCPYIDPMSLKK